MKRKFGKEITDRMKQLEHLQSESKKLEKEITELLKHEILMNGASE